DGFGILINQSFYLVGFRVCRKASLYTQAFKRNFKLIVRAAISVGAGHEVVSTLQNITQRNKLCRLTRSYSQCCYTSFESCYTLLKDIRSWIHNPGVYVAKLLQCKQVSTVFGIVKYK